MTFYYITTIPISVCYFIIALFSVANSLDTLAGIDESTSDCLTFKHNTTPINHFEAESDNSTANTIPTSQDNKDKDPASISVFMESQINLPIYSKNNHPSWISYLVSPIKVVIQNTAGIINFATQYPHKAMLVGTIIALQMAVVAADCECYCRTPRTGKYDNYLGTYSDALSCGNACTRMGYLSACKKTGL